MAYAVYAYSYTGLLAEVQPIMIGTVQTIDVRLYMRNDSFPCPQPAGDIRALDAKNLPNMVIARGFGA